MAKCLDFVSSANSSVCPGHLYPANLSDCFDIGAVTIALTSFFKASSTAFFIYLTSAMPDFLLGTPFLKGWGDLISITSILPTVGF